MRKPWKFVILIAVLAFAWIPVTDMVMAVRLLLALNAVAAGATGADLGVLEGKVQRQYGALKLEAMSYRPSGSLAKSGIVLVPGISELGSYHPRLQALSRFLANQGFMVITPDIQEFRRFEMPPEAMDYIAFWFGQARSLEGGQGLQHLGLGGISFSGTLALITAARPEIRDSAAFILAIGPYQDPLRCARLWFAAEPSTGEGTSYPTRFYAKWIIMIAALDMLPLQKERDFLRGLLVNLLLQRDVPLAPQGLSPEAQRWYRLSVMPPDQADSELAGLIEQHLTPTLYRQVSPDQAAGEVRCPVFLVHGAFDDLIPPEESRQLRKKISQAKTYLVISPFITHTHPWDKPLTTAQKARAILDLLRFFYQFARAAG